MAEGGRRPLLLVLVMMALAALAGFWLGHRQTVRGGWPFQGRIEHEEPGQTAAAAPGLPSSSAPAKNEECGRPTSHPVKGSLLKGVTLEGDGKPLMSPTWLLHVGPEPHTLKVTNTGAAEIELGLVQLYDNVDDKYQLGDSLPPSCNYPILASPGCTSLAPSGGSCTLTLSNIQQPMTTYLWISIATGGGIEVSIPIVP
jgi:hypothetical protein